MTTVAFKDGQIAADSFVWDDHVCAGRTQKCGALPDGSVWGFTGNLGQLHKCRAWLNLPLGDPPELSESSLIIVTRDGEVKEWDEHGWQICEAPFYAWGTGCDIARGAMAFGATAEQAVLIACDFDAYTGGEVRVLSIAGHEPEPDPEPEQDELVGILFEPDTPTMETLRQRLGLE